MSEITESCLYHRDRSEFTAIQKELQKRGWISQKYIHRLAMAVCSCRRHLRESQYAHGNERLNCVKTYLYDLLNKDPQTHNCSDQLKFYILNCLNGANETKYSLCKYLDILYQAKHGEFCELERQRKVSDSFKVESEEVAKESKGMKMTKNQVALMLRKRKRKYEMVVVKLLMFPGNFSKLVAESEIKNIERKTAGFIEAHNSLNDKSFRDNKHETFVKVWAKPGDNFETLRNCLMTKAFALQNCLDKKRQKLLAIIAKERKIEKECSKLPEQRLEYIGYIDDVKEIMHEDFGKKAWKSKQKTQKSTHSVLNKGHCLHCHKDFTSLRDPSCCRYHSGYLVNCTWSCCRTQTRTPSFTDHQSTGCVEAKTHVWRAHARSDHKLRKAGASNGVLTN